VVPLVPVVPVALLGSLPNVTTPAVTTWLIGGCGTMPPLTCAGVTAVADGMVPVVVPVAGVVADAAPLDEASRNRLRHIYERSLAELGEGLSPDLREELDRMALPFGPDSVPSDAELRVAQAQLVGWLEGLFHGIQATLFTQQTVAQQQLEEMRRRRAIASGQVLGNEPGPSGYL